MIIHFLKIHPEGMEKKDFKESMCGATHRHVFPPRAENGKNSIVVIMFEWQCNNAQYKPV